MAEQVRIGVEPAAPTPPRSGKALALAGLAALAVAGGVWLLGALGGSEGAPRTTVGGSFPDATTTTTTTGPSTTLPAAQRLQQARTFWWALGQGDAAAAAAAVADPAPGAGNLIEFVAAFQPGFTVDGCEEFAANAVSCLVVVSNGDLLAIGSGTADAVLNVADDGWFDVHPTVATSAARLSLYALHSHSEDVRAACPVTDDPNVGRLAIVGSASAGCGAYLATLVPEYMAVVLHNLGGARE